MAADPQVRHEFPTTRWSLIEQATSAQAQQAMVELVDGYLPALRWFLVRRFRLQSHDAQDILQSFLLDKLIQGTLLDQASQKRGRFRSLLCRSLSNYVISAMRGRKLTAPVTDGAAWADGTDQAGDAFDRAWARQVIAWALRQTRQELIHSNRANYWHLLRLRVVRPCLSDSKPPGYGELVKRLRFKDPGQAHARLATARRMLHRNLRQVVADYCRDGAEIEDELAALQRAVTPAGAR